MRGLFLFMTYRDCRCVADIVREAFDLVRCDRSHVADEAVSYYFRGMNHNYDHEGSCAVPCGQITPSIYYKEAWLEHESDFFNEALRTYPEEFARDKTTFDILTRVQHYGYPTRLLDISAKLTTAMGFSVATGYDGKNYADLNGFIQVFRVRNKRIKYGTSDTVTALSNLARLKSKRVKVSSACGLRYLEAECKNERAGFFVKEGSETTKWLMCDIRKVWCVKPMVNNIRINFQQGEFFLFGCEDDKKCPRATFTEHDYGNPDAPTEGLALIGTLIVLPRAKREIKEMSVHLDIGEHRLYPDFKHHSSWLKNRYKEEP